MPILYKYRKNQKLVKEKLDKIVYKRDNKNSALRILFILNVT